MNMTAATEAKAARLVLHGHVEIDAAIVEPDGTVLTASGRVRAGDGDTWYEVRLAPDFGSCGCKYGGQATRALPRDSHSRDLALRIAAQTRASRGGEQ